MKYFDRDNYQRHLKDLRLAETKDPFLMTTYLRGAFDIANSFNTELTETMSKEDIIQECYYILAKTWNKLDWNAIQRASEPQAFIWAYLKKTIKIQARDRVLDQGKHIRVPKNKRWDLIRDKNLNPKSINEFLTIMMLVPNSWFQENAESLELYEEMYNTRYDIEQLGLAFNDVFIKYLTHNEQFVIENTYGLDTDKISNKKIAIQLKTSEANVRKIKQRALDKLKNDEVKAYLQEFYDF